MYEIKLNDTIKCNYKVEQAPTAPQPNPLIISSKMEILSIYKRYSGKGLRVDVRVTDDNGADVVKTLYVGDSLISRWELDIT